MKSLSEKNLNLYVKEYPTASRFLLAGALASFSNLFTSNAEASPACEYKQGSGFITIKDAGRGQKKCVVSSKKGIEVFSAGKKSEAADKRCADEGFNLLKEEYIPDDDPILDGRHKLVVPVDDLGCLIKNKDTDESIYRGLNQPFPSSIVQGNYTVWGKVGAEKGVIISMGENKVKYKPVREPAPEAKPTPAPAEEKSPEAEPTAEKKKVPDEEVPVKYLPHVLDTSQASPAGQPATLSHVTTPVISTKKVPDKGAFFVDGSLRWDDGVIEIPGSGRITQKSTSPNFDVLLAYARDIRGVVLMPYLKYTNDNGSLTHMQFGDDAVNVNAGEFSAWSPAVGVRAKIFLDERNNLTFGGEFGSKQRTLEQNVNDTRLEFTEQMLGFKFNGLLYVPRVFYFGKEFNLGGELGLDLAFSDITHNDNFSGTSKAKGVNTDAEGYLGLVLTNTGKGTVLPYFAVRGLGFQSQHNLESATPLAGNNTVPTLEAEVRINLGESFYLNALGGAALGEGLGRAYGLGLVGISAQSLGNIELGAGYTHFSEDKKVNDKPLRSMNNGVPTVFLRYSTSRDIDNLNLMRPREMIKKGSN